MILVPVSDTMAAVSEGDVVMGNERIGGADEKATAPLM